MQAQKTSEELAVIYPDQESCKRYELEEDWYRGWITKLIKEETTFEEYNAVITSYSDSLNIKLFKGKKSFLLSSTF